MTKVVSLTVHKNNRDRIEDRRTSKDMISDAKLLARRKDVHGYAIIAWDRDQSAETAWSKCQSVPTNILPEFVRGALSRRISMLDNQED